ncbi:MAG: sulfur carrier protein ThiS [Rhodovarius sp.]|nr:sulfur carrier protein ThiS [Rhodovarius sp.]MCX7933423.1 sulfur carrier protein ThiS [Rhodovarius sp.]MDW8315677.1 sulfur carrier protein ThiS [Rhodovarius sp.]
MDSSIAITLNGERRQIAAATVAELLREIGLDPRKVAVERNEEIVPRSRYDSERLSPGDSVEIVHFIGGG